MVDYLSRSLYYQNIESKSHITIHTTENEYFSCYVNRSVYLLQAAVPIHSQISLKPLYDATKYLAYFGQIKNDIVDLSEGKSSDLLNARPTLPLIKTKELAFKLGNDKVLSQILSINEENYSQNIYHSIFQFINANDILEDCAKVALYYFEEAQKELILYFPHKKAIINAFFTKLILKDE